MNWKKLTISQSDKMKDIRSHMTKEEKKKSAKLGAIIGLFIAVFFAIPLSFGLSLALKNKSIAGILAIILWVLIGIPIFLKLRKKGIELYCSTKYAQEKGYTIDKIQKNLTTHSSGPLTDTQLNARLSRAAEFGC